MNLGAMTLEIGVVILALILMLVDLWLAPEHRKKLGYTAAAGLLVLFGYSLTLDVQTPQLAFGSMFVLDPLALFFKRFFLLAAFLILLLAIEFSPQLESGISEFYTLILFALSGMMWAASANDLVMVFVSLELITVTFYILTSFQRLKIRSLEAGIKYLILGALSSAFMVFGIALIFGTANSTNYEVIAGAADNLVDNRVFLLGVVLVFFGLAFKIAAFPFQLWAPDVYEGAPIPATAFLAIGSKAAGLVLMARLFFQALPRLEEFWSPLLLVISAATILYGNLCAVPQRNLKRLLGYSSIANAGYLLMGFVSTRGGGASALLYYLGAYLFTLVAAFGVIAIVSRNSDSEDVSILAGLSKRSPFLAATLALSMISLAGIPPLAGFFGKFLIVQALVAHSELSQPFLAVAVIAVIGVVISLYYYFGVIRAIYWSEEAADLSPIHLSWPMRISLFLAVAGMIFLGLFPEPLLRVARDAVRGLIPS